MHSSGFYLKPENKEDHLKVHHFQSALEQPCYTHSTKTAFIGTLKDRRRTVEPVGVVVKLQCSHILAED